MDKNHSLPERRFSKLTDEALSDFTRTTFSLLEIVVADIRCLREAQKQIELRLITLEKTKEETPDLGHI